jgi:hypothetical protein
LSYLIALKEDIHGVLTTDNTTALPSTAVSKNTLSTTFLFPGDERMDGVNQLFSTANCCLRQARSTLHDVSLKKTCELS